MGSTAASHVPCTPPAHPPWLKKLNLTSLADLSRPLAAQLRGSRKPQRNQTAHSLGDKGA